MWRIVGPGETEHLNVHFHFLGDFFSYLRFIVRPDDNCIYFLFKDGKDFGNCEWTEVGKLSSVKEVSCGTST